MARRWRTQMPLVAFILGVVAFFLVAACVLSFWAEALEPPFICANGNCVEDTRSWPDRHGGLLGLAVGAVVLTLAALTVTLSGRGKGRRAARSRRSPGRS